MWPLKTILYFILFWTGCAYSIFNPIWGVVNYMAAYQALPTGTWWGIPLVDLGMRFSFLAAVFMLLGLVFGRRHVPTVRPNISLWECGVVSLVAIGLMNLIIGIKYDTFALFAFEKFWKLQVFVLVLVRMATTRKNFHIVLWALTLGSLYIGYDAYSAPVERFMSGRLNSLGGPDIATTSGASAHLSAMLPLIGCVFLMSKNWKWKLLAAISGAFTVNAIVMCRTRSAFIGLGVGVLAAILSVPRFKRYRIYMLMGVGALAAFSLTDENYWRRMSTISQTETYKTDTATVVRREIWRASGNIVADYPIGVGLGNFVNIIGPYTGYVHHRRSSHNTLIMCFVELGIVGGLIFLSMISASFFFLWKSAKLASRTENSIDTKFMVYGCFISLITYLVAGLGTERFSCESFWWVLALPLCLYRMVLREATAPVAEEEKLPHGEKDDAGWNVTPELPLGYGYGS